MTPLVEIAGITRRYGQRAAVDRVSLDVHSNDVVALVGPSGCGKTTLLRLIAGLEAPDAGEIRFSGRVASAGSRILVPPHKRGLGFVFQDLALWPHMTIAGNLQFVMGSLGVPRAEWPARARETLALARIDALAAHFPHQLSGGEQQRAALARALIGRPPLLLLDEPLSSLDEELRIALRTELAAVQRALRVSVVCVTHDRKDAEALATRIVSMRDGRIESPA